MTFLTASALDIATSEIGVHEIGGNNRGERIEEYLAAAHAKPGDPWCASFVSWAFIQAAAALGVPNPMRPTAGALHIWRDAPELCRSKTPTIGSIFVINHGEGKGHCGFVAAVTGDHVLTIEGNTNEAGSREGDGVLRKSRRISDINVGFVDYGAEGAVPAEELTT